LLEHYVYAMAGERAMETKPRTAMIGVLGPEVDGALRSEASAQVCGGAGVASDSPYTEDEEATR